MNQGNGLFNFDTNFTADSNKPAGTGDGIAGLLLGAYSPLAQDLQLVWAGYRVLEIGTYIADDWRVTSRLTINLDLRYEFLPPPVEVANRIMNLNNQTGQVMIGASMRTGTLESRRSGTCLRHVSASPSNCSTAPC